MRIVSRHLATDNVSIMFPIVDILMLLKVHWWHYIANCIVLKIFASRKVHSSNDKFFIQVVRSNFALASKLLFKLARDDANDHHFLTRKTLELYLSIGLGRNCPFSDNDAFVYGYGALKFLTLNNKVSEIPFLTIILQSFTFQIIVLTTLLIFSK